MQDCVAFQIQYAGMCGFSDPVCEGGVTLKSRAEKKNNANTHY